MSDTAILLGKSGVLLFTLGLLVGFVIAQVRNPRQGLSAHLTAVQTGAMLVALALFWQHLAVPAEYEQLITYAVIGSSYVLTFGILLSSILGASHALPMAGKGYSASNLGEAAVTALVYGSSLVMAVAFIAICWFALF